jgi:hypothetical protein
MIIIMIIIIIIRIWKRQKSWGGRAEGHGEGGLAGRLPTVALASFAPLSALPLARCVKWRRS